jgi:hypothetical protein
MIDPAKQCQKRDCEHEATHLLKLHAPFEKHPDAEVSALIGIRLCVSCLETEHDGGKFIDANPDLRRLLAISAGAHPLDFSATWVSGVPLNSAEGQSLSLHAPRAN